MLHELILPLMDSNHKTLLPQDFNNIQKSNSYFWQVYQNQLYPVKKNPLNLDIRHKPVIFSKKSSKLYFLIPITATA